MAYKQKSPYKFLGKAVRKLRKSKVGSLMAGGIVGAGVRGIGGLMRGSGGNPNSAAAQTMAEAGASGVGGGGIGMPPGIGGVTGVSGMGPMNKKGKKSVGFKPYEHPSHRKKSPFKTDATLVRGAYDAASGKSTRKYGQIAKSRAFADMVDTVERTTNRSARVELSKARARSRKTVRSHDKFANWRERYERRRQRRQRFRDRFRTKKRKAIDYDNYNDQYQQAPAIGGYSNMGYPN